MILRSVTLFDTFLVPRVSLNVRKNKIVKKKAKIVDIFVSAMGNISHKLYT